MIICTTGNIFLSSATALVNPVNCEGISGKGLALAFKYRFPASYQAYKNVCVKDELKIGNLYIYYGKIKTIVNFPTKDRWRNPSKIEYIEKGLHTLAKRLSSTDFHKTYDEMTKISSIAIPALGCGLGGLDWNEVKALIEENLSDIDIPIYVYEPKKGTNEKSKISNV